MTTRDLADLGARLAAYLSARWQQTVTVQAVEQIPGGASRQTYRVTATQDGRAQSLIVRRDPASSLIDTERALEYRTYEAVYRAGFPVPEPLLLEEDPNVLDRPFSVMAAVPDCESATSNFTVSPWLELRDKIGHCKWSLLGDLAGMKIDELGVTTFMETPEHAAATALEYWAGVIQADALIPQPVAAATIRWLQRELPPASENLCLVHGDYRSGNFLYNRNGDIQAVLDWEMAHIGDPLEDLAWSLDPLWAWPDKLLAGGLLPAEAAIHIWEQTSGMQVDPQVFRWWQVFASLKALAIWVSSTEDFAHGTSKEPILAMAGWLMSDRQNRILVDRLHPASDHRYARALT